MQKKLSIFLSILLITAVFCGCSNQSQNVDSTTSTTTQMTSTSFETTVTNGKTATLSSTAKATTKGSKTKDKKSGKTATKKNDKKNSKQTTKKADKKTSKQATKKSAKKSAKATTTAKAKKSAKSKSSKTDKSKSPVKSTQSFVTSDAYTVETTQSHSQAHKTTAKATSTTSSKITCTITIECKSILDNMDKLAKGHEKYVPSDGIIVDNYTATFNGKATVYDLLKKACKDNNVTYSAQTTTYSVYISGINNLDEFDCGKDSGWMYSVNGKFPNVSCDSTKLKDGDKVVFTYTCSYKK